MIKNKVATDEFHNRKVNWFRTIIQSEIAMQVDISQEHVGHIDVLPH